MNGKIKILNQLSNFFIIIIISIFLFAPLISLAAEYSVTIPNGDRLGQSDRLNLRFNQSTGSWEAQNQYDYGLFNTYGNWINLNSPTWDSNFNREAWPMLQLLSGYDLNQGINYFNTVAQSPESGYGVTDTSLPAPVPVPAEQQAAQVNKYKPVITIDIPGLMAFKDVSKDNLNIDWIAQYISAIYRYGISLAVILAAIMIMAGGFLWLTSGGSPNQVGKAKEFITGSLTGLLLALFSYLLLSTINPGLVSFKGISLAPIQQVESTALNETSSSGGGTAGIVGAPGGPASSLTEQQVRAQLAANGVSVWESRSGATTVAGLSDNMINFIGDLSREVGGLTVTAGTDHGHPPDTTDFRYGANDSLSQHIITGAGENTRVVPQYGTTANAIQYDVPDEGIYTHETNPPHWDFRYGRHFSN